MLNSKQKGKLGIGSIQSFNMNLLLKWRWRFYNENQALCVKVIHNIHGVHDGLSAPSSKLRRGGMG